MYEEVNGEKKEISIILLAIKIFLKSESLRLLYDNITTFKRYKIKCSIRKFGQTFFVFLPFCSFLG